MKVFHTKRVSRFTLKSFFVLAPETCIIFCGCNLVYILDDKTVVLYPGAKTGVQLVSTVFLLIGTL